MIKVQLWDTKYGSGRGFAPVLPEGKQGNYFHHCKEVFAARLQERDWSVRDGAKKKYEGANGVVMFLFHDPKNEVNAAFAKRKEKVLHLFEDAMGFTLRAKINIVRHNGKKYLLYQVSAAWNKTLPMSHILALLVRNHYPDDRPLKDWRKVLTYFRGGAWSRLGTKAAVKEIIESKGETNPNWLRDINGISDYAAHRMLEQARLDFLGR